MASSSSDDTLVRNTNDDATISKWSCAQSGYVEDDFVQYFAHKPHKRPPIINRGYFSRIAALKGIIERFLRTAALNTTAFADSSATPPSPPEVVSIQQSEESEQSPASYPDAVSPSCQAPSANGKSSTEAIGQPYRRQVLVLGAGFDTSWFQRKAHGEELPDQWLEMDFPEVTRRKLRIMRKTHAISRLIDPLAFVSEEEGSLSSPEYSVLPIDLRDLTRLSTTLASARLQLEAPTLVLAECVLVYMTPSESAAIVSLLGAALPHAVFAVYEQIKPFDAFGRQMVCNLRERGCPLRGIEATPDLETQMQRFLSNNWSRAIAQDMATIHSCHIDPAERLRAERSEIFDEIEEWNLIQEHYCIAMGINDRDGLLSSFEFPRFGRIQVPQRQLCA